MRKMKGSLTTTTTTTTILLFLACFGAHTSNAQQVLQVNGVISFSSTKTCTDILATQTFTGTCCSLADGSGGCTLTVIGGTCAVQGDTWNFDLTSTDPGSCPTSAYVVPGVTPQTLAPTTTAPIPVLPTDPPTVVAPTLVPTTVVTTEPPFPPPTIPPSDPPLPTDAPTAAMLNTSMPSDVPSSVPTLASSSSSILPSDYPSMLPSSVPTLGSNDTNATTPSNDNSTIGDLLLPEDIPPPPLWAPTTPPGELSGSNSTNTTDGSDGTNTTMEPDTNETSTMDPSGNTTEAGEGGDEKACATDDDCPEQFCGTDETCHDYTCQNFHQHHPVSEFDESTATALSCVAAETNVHILTYACFGRTGGGLIPSNTGVGMMPTRACTGKSSENSEIMTSIECFTFAPGTDFTMFEQEAEAIQDELSCNAPGLPAFFYGAAYTLSEFAGGRVTSETIIMSGPNPTQDLDPDKASLSFYAVVIKEEVVAPVTQPPTPVPPTAAPTSGAAMVSLRPLQTGLIMSVVPLLAIAIL